ncbi:hypothetical protein STRTUCAR8_01501 [Streptomyces turgidiscabies Car8]|uniref:Uncharacterized protein n=1 Tax=Streptomyces turgidiscabies (strain Car8) TaxID=698760 RepID=L7F3N2_STRT8|nr:hypothetical protein STRTUCAR8_01501 [Streptomyces turgidiscabies Car8]
MRLKPKLPTGKPTKPAAVNRCTHQEAGAERWLEPPHMKERTDDPPPPRSVQL